jgi:hypothetical protein
MGLGYWLAIALCAGGCGAVYPELSAPIRPVPAGAVLSPPPPEDMLYLAFASAEIPERTRDGRRWDSVGGAAPDPFGKIMIGKKELLRTPVQANTLTPTWPDAPRGNHRVAKGTQLRVELWDSNPMANQPICVKSVRRIHDEAQAGGIDIVCDSGARIRLDVEPARAQWGLGFLYELRTDTAYVTRVEPESPAGRVGLKVGDQLQRIQGKAVVTMGEGEAQSAINTHSRGGLNLTVERANGRVEDLTLKEGPIYRTLGQDDPR